MCWAHRIPALATFCQRLGQEPMKEHQSPMNCQSNEDFHIKDALGQSRAERTLKAMKHQHSNAKIQQPLWLHADVAGPWCTGNFQRQSLSLKVPEIGSGKFASWVPYCFLKCTNCPLSSWGWKWIFRQSWPSEDKVGKNFSMGHSFFSIFDNSRKSNGHWPSLLSYNCSECYYTSAITAHARGQHTWLSPGPWPYPKSSRTVEVRWSC